jgi:RNA polymerase sigma-70 factor (ECF subfamily)
MRRDLTDATRSPGSRKLFVESGLVASSLADGSAKMSAVPRMRRFIEPQPEQRSDAARLLLVPREGSEAELVYERVAPVVNRVVWAYLATDAERDDIAQDIFVSIVRRRGSVRDLARLEAWAARVAFNTICKAFRRRKFRRWLSLEPLPENEQPEYHADLEGRELVVRAQRVLERLPLSQRMPLTLELFTNASQPEIAALCGCSERTLRRRLQAARERFTVLARRDPGLAARLTDASLESINDD